jgi:DNA-binding transcriptional MerR regulator
MTLSHLALWTLTELSAQVDVALAVDYPGQVNGRVREVPDIRTIRYYTTRGLLDPPAQMRGRTALYGERHLLQLVAIKRLQTKGLSLTEIQPRVMGQTNSVLRRLAQLPAHSPKAEPTETTEERANDRRRTAFWSTEPAAVPENEAKSEQKSEMQKTSDQVVHPLIALPLDEGLTLLMKMDCSLDEQDVQALRSAAAPLLKILKNKTRQARSASDG